MSKGSSSSLSGIKLSAFNIPRLVLGIQESRSVSSPIDPTERRIAA